VVVVLVVNDVLFSGELGLVAAGWQGWLSLMVKGVLFYSGLSVVVVG
jgi:hypothetical protein